MKRVTQRESGSRRVECVPEGESLTEQGHAASSDINTIMHRAERTGQVQVTAASAMYGDFTAVGDYQSALEAVRMAQAAFMSLDPAIRERFDNDPAKLLSFLDNEANRSEAERLGLIESVRRSPPAVGTEVPAGGGAQ